jgi:Zn-dependent protease/CBS domain-containing protein
MRWSWRIARVAGIDIYLHVTTVILLAWIVFMTSWNRGLEAALELLAFFILLFAIVVLHELGHALTARYFGIKTRDIILLPIGGVARLERIPRKPIQEFYVALAGPAVNFVLAALLWFVARATQTPLAFPSAAQEFFAARLLERLFWTNVMLALFNLLPAFPMDGGRILRALLALGTDYVQATQVAATVGQVMAVLFGFLGLLGNPLLLFIALFVWMGAAEEASMAQMESALRGIPVSRAMITEFHVLHPDDTLAKATDLMLAGFQQDFPVVEGERVAGVLTRADLLRGLATTGPSTKVGDVMSQPIVTADASEMLADALLRLRDCPCHSVPVLRDGQLAGILTMENLSEFLMIRDALQRLGAQRKAAGTAPAFTMASSGPARPEDAPMA